MSAPRFLVLVLVEAFLDGTAASASALRATPPPRARGDSAGTSPVHPHDAAEPADGGGDGAESADDAAHVVDSQAIFNAYPEVRPVAAQMWQEWARSRSDVGRASPVPAQMSAAVRPCAECGHSARPCVHSR